MTCPVLKAVKKPKKKEDILFCDHEAFLVCKKKRKKKSTPEILSLYASKKYRALFLILYMNKRN